MTSHVTLSETARRQLIRAAVGLQVVGLAVTLPLYPVYGLSFDLASLAGHSVFPLLMTAIWLYHRFFDRGRDAPYLSQVLLLALLMITLTNIASPAQYLAVAIGRPVIDPWLAAGDAWLGVHVPTLAAWTASHPVVSMILSACYFSLLPQLFMPVAVLGLLVRNLDRLYEYCFHFHFCLLITVVALALFPADCAVNFYGFEATIDQSRVTRHFMGFRNGTLTVIFFNDLEGLISAPSFHVAGALMCTWVFRHYRYIWPPLALINIGLMASTFMSGAHYLVDILVTLPLFGLSVMAYRAWESAHQVSRQPAVASDNSAMTPRPSAARPH